MWEFIIIVALVMLAYAAGKIRKTLCNQKYTLDTQNFITTNLPSTSPSPFLEPNIRIVSPHKEDCNTNALEKNNKSFEAVNVKLPPLKSTRGAARKTRNNLINDDLEYILFTKPIKIRFDYFGSAGIKNHEVTIDVITGTAEGLPVYIRGITSGDPDDPDDQPYSLTFRLDKMSHVTLQGRTYTSLNSFIMALKTLK